MGEDRPRRCRATAPAAPAAEASAALPARKPAAGGDVHRASLRDCCLAGGARALQRAVDGAATFRSTGPTAGRGRAARRRRGGSPTRPRRPRAGVSAAPRAGPARSRSAAFSGKTARSAARQLGLEPGGRRDAGGGGTDERGVAGGLGAVAVGGGGRALAGGERRRGRVERPRVGARQAQRRRPRRRRQPSGGEAALPARGEAGGGLEVHERRQRRGVGAGQHAARGCRWRPSPRPPAPGRGRRAASRARRRPARARGAPSPSCPAAQAARPSASSPLGGIAVPGVEAEEAQDAQVVLGDAPLGIADEAHAAGAQVGQPAERVDHRAVRPGVERVHGEVAAGGVLGDSSRRRRRRRGGRRSATSRRKVVTSNGRPPATSVTVPCSTPVGTALTPAASASAITRSRPGVGGEVDVGDRPRRAARRARSRRRRTPGGRPSVSSAQTACAGGRAQPGVGDAGHGSCIRSLSVFSMRAVAPQM